MRWDVKRAFCAMTHGHRPQPLLDKNHQPNVSAPITRPICMREVCDQITVKPLFLNLKKPWEHIKVIEWRVSWNRDLRKLQTLWRENLRNQIIRTFFPSTIEQRKHSIEWRGDAITHKILVLLGQTWMTLIIKFSNGLVLFSVFSIFLSVHVLWGCCPSRE